MENKLRIRKVHIPSLMQVLAGLYNKGVEFIDIHGNIIEGQDTLALTFNKSYMEEGFEKNFDDLIQEQHQSSIEVKLSDEDLNQLI